MILVYTHLHLPKPCLTQYQMLVQFQFSTCDIKNLKYSQGPEERKLQSLLFGYCLLVS